MVEDGKLLGALERVLLQHVAQLGEERHGGLGGGDVLKGGVDEALRVRVTVRMRMRIEGVGEGEGEGEC